jgi:ethanolamine ammonia-lyase small subunit
MGYQPRAGHTDAERNLISNIHARGVSPTAAAIRILRLVERLRQMQISGVRVKEKLESQVESVRPQGLFDS